MSRQSHHTRKRVATLVLFGALTGVIGMFITRHSHPILVRVNPEPGLLRPRSYCVTNPFRDREPERVAEFHLDQLHRGNTSTIAPFASPRDHILTREKQFPILSWRIGWREDSDTAVGMMYWVRRGGGYASGEPYEEEVHFIVSRSGRKWKIDEFSAIY